MNTRKNTLWITRTAAFIALLIALQFTTASLGQFVTGSAVNLVLILSVLLGGRWCGVAVAALSPVAAFLLGIGPRLFFLIPIQATGNLTLILIWYFVARKASSFSVPRRIFAVAAGACVKFGTLYAGIVLLASGFLPVPESVLSMFSYPQLITAAIGGGCAALLLPLLRTHSAFNPSAQNDTVQ